MDLENKIAALFAALAALPVEADFDDVGDLIADKLSYQPNTAAHDGRTERGWVLTVTFGTGDRGPCIVVRATRTVDGLNGAAYFYG